MKTRHTGAVTTTVLTHHRGDTALHQVIFSSKQIFLVLFLLTKSTTTQLVFKETLERTIEGLKEEETALIKRYM